MKSGGRPTPGRERVATAASRIQDEIAVLHARLQREQAREAREGRSERVASRVHEEVEALRHRSQARLTLRHRDRGGVISFVSQKN
jgi:hypothetical protein